VSIINATSTFRTLCDCRVERTRDGFLLRDFNGHQVAVSTSFWNESALLAVLEEIVATMKARGVQTDPKAKAAAKLPKEVPTQGLRVEAEPPKTEIRKAEPPKTAKAKAPKVDPEIKVAIPRPTVRKRKG
jgi:hypothetical protein